MLLELTGTQHENRLCVAGVAHGWHASPSPHIPINTLRSTVFLSLLASTTKKNLGKRIYNQLDEIRLLHGEQYGFRKSLSTSQQLVHHNLCPGSFQVQACHRSCASWFIEGVRQSMACWFVAQNNPVGTKLENYVDSGIFSHQQTLRSSSRGFQL